MKSFKCSGEIDIVIFIGRKRVYYDVPGTPISRSSGEGGTCLANLIRLVFLASFVRFFFAAVYASWKQLKYGVEE